MGKNKEKQAGKTANLEAVKKTAVSDQADDSEKPKYYPCKEKTANIFSLASFYWTGDLLKRGNHHYLQPHDLFDIKENQKFEPVFKQFDSYFRKFLDHKGPKTGKAILATIKKFLFINVVFNAIGNLLQFAGPLCLTKIIQNLANPTVGPHDAYKYASVMLGCFLIRSILIQHGVHANNTSAFTTIAVLQGAIFQKALKLKNSAKKYFDSGKILTLTTVDSYAVFFFCLWGNAILISPIMIITSVVLICVQVGAIGLVGPAILFLSVFIQGCVQKSSEKVRKKCLFYNDERSKALSEYITGIRVIKFYGWERMVQKKIQEIRKHEAGFIFKTAALRSMLELLSTIVPTVIAIVIFGSYQAMGKDLTPAMAYSVLSLFNLISLPLRLQAILLVALVNSKVSLRRISHFLTSEEYDNYVVREDPNMSLGDIEIQDGVFAWDTESARAHYKEIEKFNKVRGKGGSGNQSATGPRADLGIDDNPSSPKLLISGLEIIDPASSKNNIEEPNSDPPSLLEMRLENSLPNKFVTSTTATPKSSKKRRKNKKPIEIPDNPLKQEDLIVLKNINFKAKRGQLVGIIGQVGSGKTSLLNALLGELDKVGGTVKARGSVAFIPQQAFLQNATVRDNITFTFPFEEERYREIVEKCELEQDLKSFPGGDLTEIGERGINLSGGQKQRVSVARAVYANAEIYLIDDCLSALDIYIGRRIFQNILQGMLKDKTIIFVTHAMQYVEHADYLYVMKEGQIIEEGSPMELRAKTDSEYNLLSVRFNKDTTVAKEETPSSKEATKKDNEQVIGEILENQGSFTLDEIDHTIAIERLEAQIREMLKAEAEVEEQEIKTKKEELFPELNIGVKIEEEKKDDQIVDKKPEDKPEEKKADDFLTKKGTLVKTEATAHGAVSWGAWKAYMSSGGICRTLLVLIGFILFQSAKIVNDWWLGVWSSDKFKFSTSRYVYIYIIIGAATGLIVLIKGVLYGHFTRNSAQKIQAGVLWSVLRSPLSWFDVTPTGRIINRTNKDQDDIDQLLPWTLQFALQNILMLASTIIMIGIILPLFWALSVVFVIIYIWCLKRYIRASREMKRIENISRSPIVQMVSEACGGSAVIRSFEATNFYMKKFAQKYNHYLIAAYNTQFTQRWIALRIEIFGDAIIAGAAYFGCLSKTLHGIADPSLVGISISYALNIIGLLSFAVRMFGDCEMQMGSFERLLEYKNKRELEADFENPKAFSPWPTSGEYNIKDVSYQYRPNLPYVIHKISFSIKQHEKIGIIGRTGSGKSTIILGLLRILEIIENEGTNEKGTIVLDNQDISKIGLHELRKKITIIPQDSILFTGTIRSNIDPFGEYRDEKIIDILKKVSIWDSLKEPVKEIAQEFEKKSKGKKTTKRSKDKKHPSSQPLPTEQEDLIDVVTDQKELEGAKKLNMVVEDCGSNFSLGQRQLLCMARALIRDSKILLMDEATANVDEKTDHLLQKMIKHEFKNTTVITIAHRLNTLMQYDKILLLLNGKIVQFDSPINLLNREGRLIDIVRSHGKEYETKMRELAVDRERDLD